MKNDKFQSSKPADISFQELSKNVPDSKVISLPQPIAAYYHASNTYDADLLAACFAEDAILVDEGEEYHGAKAVSEHILKANMEASVMTDITNFVEKNGMAVVTATISGDFDGSPIPLDFYFTLANDKIKTLSIILAGE